MSKVVASAWPQESALRPMLEQASFKDSYSAPLVDEKLTPAEIFQRAERATPPWVGRAMVVRNAVVRRLGLTDVGAMGAHTDAQAASYKVGDRFGIFWVFAILENELVLGIDDSHLDVRVSVLKRPSRYFVSTVVTVHNWLGHLYMMPVGRVHPFVVRAMMRRADV